jgi:hypothetical protein
MCGADNAKAELQGLGECRHVVVDKRHSNKLDSSVKAKLAARYAPSILRSAQTGWRGWPKWGSPSPTSWPGGNFHEAFRHLKEWYRSVTKTQARPCFQTMEKQTAKRVDLYRRRDAPGLPESCVGGTSFDVMDDTPSDGEVRVAVAELTNGRSAGASRMRAEHLMDWLQGMREEEDPDSGALNATAGDKWRALLQLVQAV